MILIFTPIFLFLFFECVQNLKLTGLVIASRQVSSSLLFLDLLVDYNEKKHEVFAQIMLKENIVKEGIGMIDFRSTCKTCSIGSIVSVEGMEESSSDGTVQATAISLIKCSPNPKAIKRLIEYAKSGKVNVEEAASSLSISRDDILTLSTEKIISQQKTSSSLTSLDLKAISTLITKLKMTPKVTIDVYNWPILSFDGPIGLFEDIGGIEEAVLSIRNYTAPKLVTITGRVKSKLKLADGIVMDLIDTDLLRSDKLTDAHVLIKALLTNRTMNDNDIDPYTVYVDLIQPGSVFEISGLINGSTAHMTVHRLKLLQASWQPKILQVLVAQVAKGLISREEGAYAMRLQNKAILDEIVSLPPTELRWKCIELSLPLQNEMKPYTVGNIGEEENSLLKKYQKYREKFPIVEYMPDKAAGSSGSSDQEKVTLFEGKSGSRWQWKKQPQLLYMLDRIAAILSNDPTFTNNPNRKYRILDIGGGKGLLAMAIAKRFGERVSVNVLEIQAAQVVHGCSKVDRQKITNVHYIHDDASKIDISTEIKPDLIVGLHACGTLSDIIISSAIKSNASFIVCTCCFLSNQNLQVQGEYGLDYLGQPKGDVMTLAGISERQGDIASQSEGVHSLNALRAQRCLELIDEAGGAGKGGGGGSELEITLETFPIMYSGRNHVIIGDFSQRKKRLASECSSSTTTTTITTIN